MNIIGYKKGGGGSHTPVEQTDNLHSTAYARVLDLISEGEIVGPANGLQSIYLDETPLANPDGSLNFSGVSVDFRPGTQDQEHIAGFPSVENEIGVGIELTSKQPWIRAFSNLQLSAVRVRLSADGLSKANTSNGDINGYRVEYAIDLSTDNGDYMTVLQTAFDGKTTSKYERTHRIDLPRATSGWSLRVRRLTANANSSTTSDRTSIVSFTEVIDAKLRYPMSAIVGIQVDAAQFQSIPVRGYDMLLKIVKVPSNYDPDKRTYDGDWDGTFKPAWTNNPAWVFYDLVLNDRYGLGHLVSEEQIDKWSLYRIAQYADQMVPDGKGGFEPRFTCNVYIQSRKEAYAVLQDMASIFRGIAYWAGGNITASADMPVDPVYTYTAANVIDGKFTRIGSSRKTRYTVALVSWNDPADFYRAKVEYVSDDEGISRYGVQQLEITAFGCTSQGEAQRRGHWALMTSRLETETISFSVGLDGAIALPGQIVRIADPHRMGRRNAGRIRSASGKVVVLDKAPTVSSGDKLTVILPTGETETQLIARVVDDSVTVNSDWSTMPVENAVWSVDSADLVAPTYRIVSVTEKDGMTYEITAVQHEPGKFDYIDKAVKIESRPESVRELKPVPVTNIDVNESLYVVGIRSFGIRATVSWTSDAHRFECAYRKENGTWTTLNTRDPSIDIYGLDEAVYEFSVIAISSTGMRSEAAVLIHEIVGLKRAPANVPWFVIEGNTLSWGEVSDLDVDGYLIRFHYGHNRNWDDASPLHTGVLTQCPFTPEKLPQGPITLMIKAVDTSGNESAKPAVIETRFGDVLVGNVIETIDFQEQGYPGVVTGAERSDGMLKVMNRTDFFSDDNTSAFFQRRRQ
ncbi:phage tail protein [Oxalobacter aliiformigenes]|uniref:Phage tail protein n=1 Tax=Oxalobacter aliiformigenes TaxID=2946593 RepID=A0A9E9NSI1_9BURK|nr:phage tail protein [Oxalobacter aliiformigenes]WAV90450.1 phage tail protein [Oxalobacter aliiformigenes]